MKKKIELKHLPLRINHGLTLAIWKSRPLYIDWARNLFKDDMGSELVSVLRNNQPYMIPRGTLDATTAAYELGRVRGYMDAINTLAETALDNPSGPADVPVDYGTDEELSRLGIKPNDTE